MNKQLLAWAWVPAMGLLLAALLTATLLAFFHREAPAPLAPGPVPASPLI